MHPALLVIDVQKGIDEVAHWGGNRNNPDAEGNIKMLLEAWRQRNLPVVIIQHCSVHKDSPFYPGKPGNDLKDFVVPFKDDLIRKRHANAFLETSLKKRLDAENIKQLFITGFVTNNSVESTARFAGESGYDVVVVSDATAAFNKTGLDGTLYSSEMMHQISLSNLHGEYARIYTAREVLSFVQTSATNC